MTSWLWTIPEHNFWRCISSRTFAIRRAGMDGIRRIEIGDSIFAYIPGVMQIRALLTADSTHFQSDELIWDDGVYPHRVTVRPEHVLSEENAVPVRAHLARLEVAQRYPTFGLVARRVVHELPESDAALLRDLVLSAPALPQDTWPESSAAPLQADSPAPPLSVGNPTDEVARLRRELHAAKQQIGLLEREVGDLERLLALAGPNLEDYLRLAFTAQGPEFEEATRKCFVAMGFVLDDEYRGQPGEIDFVTIDPYYVFAECQTSGNQAVGVSIVDKLQRHTRRYIQRKGIVPPLMDVRLAISEHTTPQLIADARTEGVGILRPSQVAALLKLRREFPGAVHPYNLRPILSVAGDLSGVIAQFIDTTREEIDKRVGVIDVLKNDRFGRAATQLGRELGWIQAYVERELESHISTAELESIIRELTSPLVGCVGVVKEDTRERYYYIRDYDFQVAEPVRMPV